VRYRRTMGKKGLALVLAVTVVALLSILVVDFMGRAWVEAAVAAGYRDETLALYAARSGQEAAKLLIMEEAKNSAAFAAKKDDFTGGGIPLPIGDDYAFFNITDESGKIDLNQMVTGRGYANDRWIEVFRRLLTRAELDPNLANAAVDWLDADSELRPDGAETDYYAGLPIPYKAKNAKFDSVDELALVKGFEPKALAKIRDHVTVWSSGRVNINTATPLAIMALDDAITDGMVKDLLKARKEAPFAAPNDVSKVPGFPEVFPRIALLISVSSDYYSVSSNAMFNETSKTIVAVYQRNMSGVKTLYYKNI